MRLKFNVQPCYPHHVLKTLTFHIQGTQTYHHCAMKTFCMDSSSWKGVPLYPVDNKSALVQAMAWCQSWHQAIALTNDDQAHNVI